ncbi:MAG: ATP-binding cassette domain-containing protein [Acholeplasmataceae bacterium]
MIAFRNVTYKSFLYIENLVIEQGDFTFCVGSSGSGKTTMLKLIVKLIEPSTGTISFHGEDIRDIDAVSLRKRIAFLPQEPYVFPGSISDNLRVGLDYHRIVKKEEDLLGVLSRVELQKNLNDDAKHLSGGEAQRLALARVLLLDPEVLLLDEPSSALDPASERVMMDILDDLNKKEKKSILMVTHRREVAEAHADTIVKLGGESRDD